jgi:predicted nucleic acid-binding protein
VILDTNGLSAMAHGDMKPAPLLQQADELAVPVVVLGEYQFGIRLSRHRMRYQSWLTESSPASTITRSSHRTSISIWSRPDASQLAAGSHFHGLATTGPGDLPNRWQFRFLSRTAA